MGFPRGNDFARLYLEKEQKSYLMVITANGDNGCQYDAVGNAYDGSSPSLASTGASKSYLLNKCKRVEWSDLPEKWKIAFLKWMDDDARPENIRGFWKVENFSSGAKRR